jgi:hypothetical protein
MGKGARPEGPRAYHDKMSCLHAVDGFEQTCRAEFSCVVVPHGDDHLEQGLVAFKLDGFDLACINDFLKIYTVFASFKRTANGTRLSASGQYHGLLVLGQSERQCRS